MGTKDTFEKKSLVEVLTRKSAIDVKKVMEFSAMKFKGLKQNNSYPSDTSISTLILKKSMLLH